MRIDYQLNEWGLRRQREWGYLQDPIHTIEAELELLPAATQRLIRSFGRFEMGAARSWEKPVQRLVLSGSYSALTLRELVNELEQKVAVRKERVQR